MEPIKKKNKETFIVTQIINPNYFMLFNPHKRQNEELKSLEKQIEQDVEKSQFTTFQKGDVVGFYWQEGHRYIRCEIDDIIEFNFVLHYLLYALDYGVSIYTTQVHDIRPVSILLKFSSSSIMHKVSLKVFPARAKFDFIENKEEIIFTNIWSELAIKIFNEGISKALDISFEVSTEKGPKEYRGYIFGDLILTTIYGAKFSLCETLVDAKVAKYASSPKEFIKNFDKVLERNIERWNDNSKMGGILKMAEGKFACYYEDEIILKSLVVSCETVQSSVQKVKEWQEKNHGFEDAPECDVADNWNTAGPSNVGNIEHNKNDDEGFEEGNISTKRLFPPNNQVNFNAFKRAKKGD